MFFLFLFFTVSSRGGLFLGLIIVVEKVCQLLKAGLLFSWFRLFYFVYELWRFIESVVFAFLSQIQERIPFKKTAFEIDRVFESGGKRIWIVETLIWWLKCIFWFLNFFFFHQSTIFFNLFVFINFLKLFLLLFFFLIFTKYICFLCMSLVSNVFQPISIFVMKIFAIFSWLVLGFFLMVWVLFLLCCVFMMYWRFRQGFLIFSF